MSEKGSSVAVASSARPPEPPLRPGSARGRRSPRAIPSDAAATGCFRATASGIQLFTVRDQVASLGFEAVFARLSEIGYREIEFAG